MRGYEWISNKAWLPNNGLTGEVTNNYNRCACRQPYRHPTYQPEPTDFTPFFITVVFNYLFNSAPVTQATQAMQNNASNANASCGDNAPSFYAFSVVSLVSLSSQPRMHGITTATSNKIRTNPMIVNPLMPVPASLAARSRTARRPDHPVPVHVVTPRRAPLRPI